MFNIRYPLKNNTKISILYVDDEPELLEIGKLFLMRSHDFLVSTHTSAKAVLKSSDILNYDAIISDYEMPEMDGISFLKSVRKTYGNVPFILFTGRGREEVVIEAINNGANYYLQKGGDPVYQFAELEHKIRQAVKINQAENVIKESQKTLSDLIDFLPDPIIAIDLSGKVIAWNRAIEKMSGISAEDMLGKDNFEYAIPHYGYRRPLLLDLIDQPDEIIAEYYKNIRRSGNLLIAESEMAYYLDKPVLARVTTCHLYNQAGEITGSIESVHDISDVKKAEIALRKSEERYRSIVNDQNDMIVRFTPDGTITFLNEAFRCMYTPESEIEDVLGVNIHDIITCEKPEPLNEFFSSHNPQTPYFETECIKTGTDEKQYCHLWLIRALYDESHILYEYQAVGRDITRRNSAEKAVIESESRFRSFIETSLDAVMIIDEEGKVIELNPSMERLIGIQRDEIMGTFLWDIIFRIMLPEKRTRENYDRFKQAIRSSLSSGISLFREPVVIEGEREDGTRFIARKLTFPIKTEKGYSYGCIAEDITQYKHAKEALQDCEERLCCIADHGSDLIALFDKNMRLYYASPASSSLLGYYPDELVGNDITFAILTIFSQSGQKFQEAVQKIMNGHSVEKCEITICTKTGEKKRVYILAVPVICDGNFEGAHVLMRDIAPENSPDVPQDVF